MNKEILIYCIAIATCLMACKTDDRKITADLLNFPPAEGSTSDGEVPVISFDSVVCRFGTIAIGEKVTHTYRFENIGNEPLIIQQVKPSCGCTTSKDWSKEPILPGEHGQITVEFNSKGFPGAIDKSISVLTNCIPAEWTLKLQGMVSGVEAPVQEQQGGVQMERTR
ncbi:MAG: DUF1573 domain-containing protein [Flavobacteriales bacterium]